MVRTGRRTNQPFHEYHHILSFLKKIYFLLRIFFCSFLSKSAFIRPLLILVSERYFAFFWNELNPPGSVFMVYNGNSNGIKIIDEKERDFYFNLNEIKKLKKLADYLIRNRFTYAIVLSDVDYEQFTTYFQFIRAEHRICLNKNHHKGLKKAGSDCMIKFNLGTDEANNTEKIRYYFKNVLGITV